jgi:hypothetical protein
MRIRTQANKAARDDPPVDCRAIECCGGGSGTVKCEVGGKLVVQLNEGSFFGTATKLSVVCCQACVLPSLRCSLYGRRHLILSRIMYESPTSGVRESLVLPVPSDSYMCDAHNEPSQRKRLLEVGHPSTVRCTDNRYFAGRRLHCEKQCTTGSASGSCTAI